jgi:glutamyl-tRNA synthetase
MYAFCSIVDDYTTNVTDIIRGADHITNTAGQKQMFEALNAAHGTNKEIKFWHLPLFQAKEGKISKRVGGFGISELAASGIEKKAILNFLASLGRSTFSTEIKALDKLIEEFDISDFSKSEVIYDPSVLETFNLQCLATYEFQEVQTRLNTNLTKDFFDDFKHNISKIEEINHWFEIANDRNLHKEKLAEGDIEFFNTFLEIIKKQHHASWNEKWEQAMADLKKQFPSRKGKEFFMPIRIGLSGLEHGTDLKTFAKWKLKSI